MVVDNNPLLTLKQQKEAFVTGHHGTTPLELVILCTAAPIGTFIYMECNYFLKEAWFRRQRKSPFWLQIALEYVFVLLPMCLDQSFLFIPWGVGLLVVQLLLALVLNSKRKSRGDEKCSSLVYLVQTIKPFFTFQHKNKEVGFQKDTVAARSSLLTSYRATVLYMTFVAILAVDFNIFPRRYAKTETYGYGLMDLGAGSFIYSSALVSSFAKGASLELSKKVLHRYTPLMILGLIRLVTHKGLDYQEHVSEYGVHWNFFFTLMFVFICSHFVRSFLNIRSISLSFLVIIIYQYFLTNGGQYFIENAPRFYRRQLESTHFSTMIHQSRNILLANREGVLGSIGYLALYLLSEHIGSFCLWKCAEKGYHLKARLLLVSLILWTLHWLLTGLLQIPVSRRSTNASYIVWIMAHNTLQLFFYSSILATAENNRNRNRDSSKSETEPKVDDVKSTLSPPLFESINRNGLLIFVLANLITGVVNISVNTISCSTAESFIIMLLYSLCLSALSLLMDWIRR